MFELRRTHAFVLAVLCFLTSGAARAASCDAFLNGEMNWVRSAPKDVARSIQATITSLNKNRQASYMVARLDSYSLGGCGLYFCPSLTHYGSQPMFFNTACDPEDSSCHYPFGNGTYKARVTIGGSTGFGVQINPDQVGVPTITIPTLTCENDVMYGFSSQTTPGMYIIRLVRAEVPFVP